MNPLASWTEEQRSAYLYRACAEAETGTVRAELFRRLAGEAEAQAAIWRAQLTAKGHPAPAPFTPDTRTRLVAWLVARLGPRRLSGIAGMAAGAFAMAAGEYVSVQSQRELYEHQIALERDELKQYPEAEAQELALIYAAKGLPKREAGRLAQRMVADPEHALDTLAREELGLNPDELGSPLGAAASSFVSFAAGGLLPLLPYLVAANGSPFASVVSIPALGLFCVWVRLSLFIGRSSVFSGARG